MTHLNKFSAALLIPVLAGCGIAAAGSTNVQTAGGDGPVRCMIETERQGGSMTIAAIALARDSIDATYRLTVRGSGNGNVANISQGGEFTAAAGEGVDLGRVSLGSGGNFDVRLEIRTGGTTALCEERIGSI